MPDPPPTEQRVSNLVGDRLCIKCGYNLTGQSVLREPHYNMLIVRCPECGTVASVQEYPLLGRWANRWAAFLAALWFLIMVGMWIGSGATIFRFSVGTAEEAASTYGVFLGERFQIWQADQIAKAGGTTTQPVRNFWTLNDYQAWWDQQDQAALFAKAGGWRGAVTWSALLMWIPYSLIVFTLGCFWALALVGRGWSARIGVALLVMAVACGFSIMVYFQWHNPYSRWGWGFAQNIIGPTVLVICLAFGAVAFTGGLAAGRALGRGLIRLLLPPRLRGSLAGLWIADGLEPPLPGKLSRRTMKREPIHTAAAAGSGTAAADSAATASGGGAAASAEMRSFKSPT